MPLQPASTTFLIIPLILNTVSAPPQTWLMENSSIGDLGSGWHAGGFLPSLSPVRSCSDSGVVNITGSPRLAMVSLDGEGNHSTCHAWSYGGPPRVREFVSSYYSFGFASYSSASSEILLPMMQEPIRVQRGEHLLCGRYTNPGPVSKVWYHSLERGTFVSPRRRTIGHRKLLGSHGHGSSTNKNVRRRRRQVLLQLQEERVGVVRAAAVAAALAILGLLCAIAGIVVWCMRNNKLQDHKLSHGIELCPSGCRRYSHRELAAATGGFAEAEKIGRGGFGPVYRGFLADQERHVAVKVLSPSVQAQGLREFRTEVEVMTRLRHRNIVQILGWCGDGEEGRLMLVYELVPNGSLDSHLHDPHQRLLAWPDRYKIALGVGSAILYLHTECEQCVLHGDIKPANILLDASCNAKLGDFGLARLVDHGADPHTTQVVAGTPGYMDPEFVSNGRPSMESDVFSFGVVLLELACGRRSAAAQPNGAPALVNWVRGMYRRRAVLGAADRRLDGEFDRRQMLRVLVAGLWCTLQDQSQRPTIAQAVDLLRRQDAEVPILPEMHSPGLVRSFEEMAYGDLSAEDSVLEDSSSDTAYHTSEDATCLLGEE